MSQGGRDVAIVKGTEKELVNRPVLESLEEVNSANNCEMEMPSAP